MSQVLHIFQKDLYRLRWELAAALGLTFLLAWLNGDNALAFPAFARHTNLPGLRNILTPLSLLAWWFVVISLIHGEPLPGERQFWLTRPYRRGSLLSAKLLFIAACILLPLLLADILTLWRAELPLPLSGLLWKPVFFGVFILLPALAFASVTATLTQTILALLGSVLAIALLQFLPLPDRLNYSYYWWTCSAQTILALAGASLLLYWQYQRRRTLPSRILLGLSLLLIVSVGSLLPWHPLFALQQKLDARPGAGASYQLRAAPERGAMRDPLRPRHLGDTVSLALPLEQSVADGQAFLGERVEIRWQDQQKEGKWTEQNGQPWLLWSLKTDEFARWKGQPLTVTAEAFGTYHGDPVRATRRLTATGERNGPFGVCGLFVPQQLFVWCRHAYQAELYTRVRLRDRETGRVSEWTPHSGASYAPMPIDPGFSPINSSLSQFPFVPEHAEAVEVEFLGLRPLDHLTRTVRFAGLRLEEFVVK
ncbi:MAG: hypothetical protein K2X03_06120 [Bryobacteraceae bacterium]|nr:hypothetical protein [Bryobacteraceae bacterium]